VDAGVAGVISRPLGYVAGMGGAGKWLAVTAVAAVAAVLLVVFAVLKGGDTAGVALADAAQRIEGESMRMRVTAGIADSTGDYAIGGEALVAADSSSGSYELKIAYGNEKPVDVRMLNIGDEYWYRFEQFRRIMPRGKPWVHSLDRTVPSSSLTPSEWVEFLAEADDVQEIDDDVVVLGKPVTHYRGVVDVAKLADEVGGESEQRFEALLDKENLPDGARVGLPIEAWIGDDGLPVRMRVSADARNGSVDMTTDVLEYGVSVDVEPPPASKTIEEAEFNRLTGG
jgi:hypothetical protein